MNERSDSPAIEEDDREERRDVHGHFEEQLAALAPGEELLKECEMPRTRNREELRQALYDPQQARFDRVQG